MSNVVAFKSAENFSTITFRSNEWVLDTEELQNLKTRQGPDGGLSSVNDFRVTAHHDKGTEPFEAVSLEVYVDGRQKNEHFTITRKDAIALRDMFAQVATTMRD